MCNLCVFTTKFIKEETRNISIHVYILHGLDSLNNSHSPRLLVRSLYQMYVQLQNSLLSKLLLFFGEIICVVLVTFS